MIICGDPVNQEIQSLVDQIWGQFEKNELTEGKEKPVVRKSEGGNYAGPIEVNAIYIDEDGIRDGIYEASKEAIVLEELTHKIRQRDGDDARSADFSPEFMRFVADQTGIRIATKREIQTFLFEKWYDSLCARRPNSD